MTKPRQSPPREVSKGVLKARMLELFRAVEKSGEEMVVTDNGKPVLRIVPFVASQDVDSLFADARPRARLPAKAVMAGTASEWSEL